MQKISFINNERYIEIISVIKDICDKSLNKKYFLLAESLCKEMFKLNQVNLNKGKANSWACGIIHALGLRNGLFKNKSEVTVKAGDLYKLFEVSSSTGLLKSKEVRNIVNIEEDRWLLSSTDYKEENKLKNTVMIDQEVLSEICVSEMKLDINKEDLKRANDLINKAWNQKSYNKRVKLAKEALEISPNCSEAYIILSYDKTLSKLQQKNLIIKAVETARDMIGENNIKNYIGNFLEVEITRSYYSAKYRLANLLWSINEKKEAINEFIDLITLCPEDKLLIRGILLSWLISENFDCETEKLLNQYKNDYLPATRFSKALYLFKIGKKDEAERALRIANSYNPFVIDYIIKKKRIPKTPPRLKRLGTEEDAIYYIKHSEIAWSSVDGAINWVMELKNKL